jgi:uroporphyrinogen-III synthase
LFRGDLVRLLVTRPREDAERTAAALRARGHTVMLAPLLHIEPVAAAFGPGPFAAVLTTSANAARAIAAHGRIAELRRLPLYTVGRRSAEAARAAGFTTVESAEGDANDLISIVARELAGAAAPLLYLAGEERSVDLGTELARHGLKVRTAVVYRAAAAERLPSEAEQAIAAGEIDGVLHYSRRSAETFVRCAAAADLCERALAPIHFCLSAQVAEPLATSADVRVAPRPEEEALLELIVASS